MASLWSLLRKGKVDRSADFRAAAAISGLAQTTPVLVDISPLVQQYRVEQRNIGMEPLDVTPPHPCLWIEYLNPPGFRQAACVERVNVPPPAGLVLRSKIPFYDGRFGEETEAPPGARHYIAITLWEENEGSAHMVGSASLFGDHLGHKLDYFVFPEHDDWQVSVNAVANWALEAITVMNTRHTRIEPPLDRHAEIVKPSRAPNSVWHTIHLPRFQAPPLENALVDGPVLERREHWVRAHRADYRQGAGMFGRIKALVWIPEHKRGNPELGTVKQSFKVHPPEQR